MKFDPSLIQEWTRERQSGQPPIPYLASYENNGTQLNYIAASHQQKDPLSNPTLPLIAETVDRVSPRAVVIEMPEDYRMQPGDVMRYGEAAFAASMATMRGISYIGGEAADKEVFKHLEANGYSEAEGKHFYLLRAMIKENGVAGKTEDELFQKANAYFKPEEQVDKNTFDAWFKGHNTSGKPLMEMTSLDIVPTQENGNYFQSLNHEISSARELHLNQVIENAVNQYGNVLVVYGGGHHVKSLPVLEAALGAPEYSHAAQGTQTGMGMQLDRILMERSATKAGGIVR